MSLKTARLRAITLLDQCEKHAERLEVAQKDLQTLGAFDAARLTNPTKEDADLTGKDYSVATIPASSLIQLRHEPSVRTE